MLFFNYTFLFWFLPVVLLGYYGLPGRGRHAFLLLASCVFYAVSSLVYLPLLLFSICFDYFAAQRIDASERREVRRWWLVCSIATNLGLLAYFKYGNLITTTLREQAGLSFMPIVQTALPVGISFYTFQSMSYTIDVYRRHVQVAPRFTTFGAFVTMFPQLIAGPIIRYAELGPQLERPAPSLDRFASGVFLLIVGLAKKLLVADTLAAVAEPLFSGPAPGTLEAWAGMLLFAGQIYFDFSGYSDMAIGLGRMLGFEFPINFDSPYKATSFSDFWRRWHITLSVWLRDYLYVPLGGNRRGAARTYVNLIVTMLLGGLWHGASWNFALWGLLHGTFLAVERGLRPWASDHAPPVWLRRGLVFMLVTVAWVPFKFERVDSTLAWLSAMFGGGEWGALSQLQVAALLCFFGLIRLPRNSGQWRISLSLPQAAYACALLAAAIVVGYGRLSQSPFLYFRF